MAGERVDNTVVLGPSEKYNSLSFFICYIDGLSLGTQTAKFDPGRKEKIISNNPGLANSLPGSIRSISFPNGETIDIGADTGGRTIDWDIFDVISFTNNLARHLGKLSLQLTYR